MNVVYVLSPEGVPLMPCSCVIARLLLKDGKAKVVRRTPFTIKLYTQRESTYTQALTLGIDTGSSVPLAIVRKLKQESTLRLWRRYEAELKRHYWKERTFWSDGYFCCTIGNASQETIRHYIESQG